MTLKQRYLILFLISSAIVGLAYWYSTDWMVYIGRPDENPEPKFLQPLWIQLLVSALFGCLIGGTVVGIIAFVHWLWLKRLGR